MRILITGASGFIGSHAAAFFESRGMDVRVFSRGKDTAARAQTLDDPDFDRRLEGVSAVLHAAGLAHARGVSDSELHEINTIWPAFLAERARRQGIRFLFLSSSKVYGETGHFSERSPRKPGDAYARAKAGAEERLEHLENCLIFRPPPVYGPGSKGSFRALISAVEKGWPLPVGSIQSRRSYVFVLNLLSAIEHLWKSGQSGIWNITDGADISLSDLTSLIGKTAGVRSRSFPFPVPLLRALMTLRPGLFDKVAGEFTLDTSRLEDSGFKRPFDLIGAMQRTLGVV